MNDQWSTPQDFFDKLDKEFKFDLDVCAESWNAKCDRFFSPEDNGLLQPWKKNICWMNPPYGELRKWIPKAYLESTLRATVVCLIPARTDTHWWHDYCLKGEVRFIRGRIHFADKNGKSGHPRFGSAVVIFRPEMKKLLGGIGQ